MREFAVDKLLTIVIPVYNGEKYLRDMLDSLLEVQFPMLEILLIDDGSTDSSASIISDYNNDDFRIKYIYEENRGIVEARNKGLYLAEGKYVCFFDQDDIVNLDVYLELLKKMQEEDAQMGLCNTGRYICGSKSEYERIRESVYKKDEVKNSLLYPILFRGYDCEFNEKENYLYGTIWKCIFEKKFLENNQIRFQRFVSYEDDWIFVVTSLTKATTVVSSGKTGYYWRVNPSSESHAGKCIDNICEKMKQLDEYMFCYLEEVMSEDALHLYRKIQDAEHLLEYLSNEWNGKRSIKLAKFLETYQGSSDKYPVPKVGIRKKIVLRAMNVLGIRAAYMLNGMALILEDRCAKVNFFVRIERCVKLRGSCR